VLAFSPDGSYALAPVTASALRTIVPAEAVETLALLNTVNGDRVKLIRINPDQQPSAVAATFRADGRAAALTVGKKTVQVITVPDVEQIGGLLQHDADVVAVAFAPNGSVVATATDDGVISVWEIRSTIPAARIRPSRRWMRADVSHGLRTPTDKKVRMLLFRQDGDVLLSSTPEGVQLWRVHSGMPIVGRWLRTPDPVVAAAFRSNRSELLIGTDNGAFEVRNIDTGLRVNRTDVADRSRPLNAIAVSPDGAHVLTTEQDGVIRRWSAEPERRVELEEGTASIEWGQKMSEWQDRLALVFGVNDGQPIPKYPLDERLVSEGATPRPSNGKTSPHLAEGWREKQAQRGR
jgi:WD40 repeat protein